MGKLNWVERACAAFLMCIATAIVVPAQTFTTLHSFDGTDGVSPYVGLVQGTNGNLYGTSYLGGTNGYGTIFKIAPNGALITLIAFDVTDGADAYAALLLAADGNFYGTTSGGGAKGSGGSVFKITPSGELTTLYSFCSQSGCSDGAEPIGGLVQASDGNLYGTTQNGGAAGYGTVFKITLTGTLTTLYSFCSQSNCGDGSLPHAALVAATSGNFYGTTPNGGANGDGTIFRITPSGTLTTLYSFCSQSSCTDGRTPYAGLVQATDGNFYGTTNSGGANGCTFGCGTVFRITPSGALTTLHTFDSTDGGNPVGGLVQATDGSLYGTTYDGGANNLGTVFKITPSGTLTTLQSFDSTDGAYPNGSLVQDTNGNFYGTTVGGGTYGDGAVFSLSVGLGTFVEPQPAIGKVGQGVRILGTNLTGATSATFNGTPAVFKVMSSSFITATVPAGATSGKVQVTTPSGTLSSNVPFRVLP